MRVGVEDLAVEVAVGVDEAGEDQAASAVEAFGVRISGELADLRDAPSCDQHVGAGRLGSAAVDDSASDEQQVRHRGSA